MELELPYPPSINHLWKWYRNRTVLSKAGRDYRAAVRVALAAQKARMLLGPLAMDIDAYPPDRRRRDLDNALKSLLDALQHGGAFFDDSQIDDLHIRRRECVPGGCVRVRLKRHEGEQAPNDQAKPRTCLKCGRWFHSTGPAHRICSLCRA